METEFNSRACPKYEALLEDMLNGELNGAGQDQVAGHLKSCPGCREALEAAKRASNFIRLAKSTAETPPEPGPAFSRIVMARIRAAQHSQRDEAGFWQPLVAFAARVALAAMLALTGLVAYSAIWHAPQPTAVAMSAPGSQELFGGVAAVPQNRDEVLMMVADTSHGK